MRARPRGRCPSSAFVTRLSVRKHSARRGVSACRPRDQQALACQVENAGPGAACVSAAKGLRLARSLMRARPDAAPSAARQRAGAGDVRPARPVQPCGLAASGEARGTHQASASARLYVNRYAFASPMARARHAPARRRACFTLLRVRSADEMFVREECSARAPPPRARRPTRGPGAAPPFLRSLPLLRNGVGDEGCGVAVRARNCVRAAEGWQLAFDRSALALATLRRARPVWRASLVQFRQAAQRQRAAGRAGVFPFRVSAASGCCRQRPRPRPAASDLLACAHACWARPGQRLHAFRAGASRRTRFSATLRVSPCCCVPAHCPRCPTAAAFLTRGADNVPRAPSFASSAGCTFAG